MMKVLFRCDASSAIGGGHLMRCRSLARALRSTGSDILFCIRSSKDSISDEFLHEFRTVFLPLASDYLVKPELGQWLPVSEEKDAFQTGFLDESDSVWKPDWIIVDHYGLSSIWHTQIRSIWPQARIVVIDDLANRSLDPDLLVDHNTVVGDPFVRYQDHLPVDSQINHCFGPDYSLIDPLHASLKGSLPVRKHLKKLMISLGGAGDLCLLEQILEVLLHYPRDLFHIQLVQGFLSPESTRINALCELLQVEKFSALPSLIPLMISADLAIGAGGTTTWERLCLGLPCITYSLAENQEHYSQKLHDDELINYLGLASRFNPNDLMQSIQYFLNNPSDLSKKSSDGMALVDGNGCLRIARIMSAVHDPLRWSKVNFRNTDNETAWIWPDSLSVRAKVSTLSSPMRSIDQLEVIRHSESPPVGFLGQDVSPSSHKSNCNCITVLSGRNSWMNLYIPSFLQQLLGYGCRVRWIHDHSHIQPGDVCFLLSYDRIVSHKFLSVHRHNLVVHASALPQGKGWSPMTWQILEGSTKIPLTLFEAVPDLDAGPIYDQTFINLDGHELIHDWQRLQAQATIHMCSRWIRHYLEGFRCLKPQSGVSSFYSRRRPEDSRLDPYLTLQEQFSILQVVDNHAYPAFFDLHGHRYKLHIFPYTQPSA